MALYNACHLAMSCHLAARVVGKKILLFIGNQLSGGVDFDFEAFLFNPFANPGPLPSSSTMGSAQLN